MNNNNNKSYEFFASFLLPEGILDWFDLVKVEEEKLKISKKNVYTGILHVYLDERDNRKSGEESLQELRPNGFTEPALVNDFPIRDKKVVLHIRRRRWTSPDGHNVVLNVYPLAVTGTRYSKEFADFLKERLGYIPGDGTFAGTLLQD
ncbi:MAG: hypothetical protein LKE47_00330 [Prevotella sp.]|jgi:hypothetical protein|nr:hypothetical protein [Prevotella sp.]MCH3968917.1 hypothetical protein [Prevotella sp.]MCH4018427.1 hypothetical protein [Prevotella sp.]MCH4100475.1 hypothetical protein [Prevotella sp.]MCI1548501.1 hypothetical protein [Prevotella sp.]